jgi:hypothetical protein
MGKQEKNGISQVSKMEFSLPFVLSFTLSPNVSKGRKIWHGAKTFLKKFFREEKSDFSS